MKRHIGSFMTWIMTVIVIILLCGTSVLAVITIRDRNITKGELLLKNGNYAEALEVFKKADKYSLRPEIRVVRGLAESSIGLEDYEAATHHYETLISIDPENAKAHYTLGLLYIRAKNFGAAEKEVGALRNIGTEESISGAEELTSDLQSGMVKGFFRDLFKKIAPSFPKIPGLTEDGPIEQKDDPTVYDVPPTVPKSNDTE